MMSDMVFQQAHEHAHDTLKSDFKKLFYRGVTI